MPIIEIMQHIIHGENAVQQIRTRLVVPDETGVHPTPLGDIAVDMQGMHTTEYPRQLRITGDIVGEGEVTIPMYDDIYGPTVGTVELDRHHTVRAIIDQ